MERFRQSLAKRILATCPAIVRREIDHPPAPTEEMQFGSLVDALVFGGAEQWTIVDAPDWRTKAAREKRGTQSVLGKTYSAAVAIADRIEDALEAAGIDMPADRCQRYIEWTSQLGVECAGTPDYYDGDVVYDLKLVDHAHPRFLQRQAINLAWHIQAAAYREGIGIPKERHQHIIIAAERHGSGSVLLCPLAPELIDIGQREWERAQGIWAECLRTGEWPQYQAHVIEAPRWLIHAKDADSEDSLEELGLEFEQ